MTQRQYRLAAKAFDLWTRASKAERTRALEALVTGTAGGVSGWEGELAEAMAYALDQCADMRKHEWKDGQRVT